MYKHGESEAIHWFNIHFVVSAVFRIRYRNNNPYPFTFLQYKKSVWTLCGSVMHPNHSRLGDSSADNRSVHPSEEDGKNNKEQEGLFNQERAVKLQFLKHLKLIKAKSDKNRFVR